MDSAAQGYREERFVFDFFDGLCSLVMSTIRSFFHT